MFNKLFLSFLAPIASYAIDITASPKIVCSQLHDAWPSVFTDPNANCCSFHASECSWYSNPDHPRSYDPVSIGVNAFGGYFDLHCKYCEGFIFSLTLENSTVGGELPNLSGVQGLSEVILNNNSLTGSISSDDMGFRLKNSSEASNNALTGIIPPWISYYRDITLDGNCFENADDFDVINSPDCTLDDSEGAFPSEGDDLIR
ncbi:hypothetical protein BCR33DRAFT_767228 [Rhizoclosmatium globosum]|uniref:L domain-like protein n=1 Tax=Rhizoclosmatium globosum TaxID=329046 RepID=A0A1Y2C7U5_9FUNG|nr:hypothetical protein BCR33DRAFT_767228 [Rhizoclosmatium globosum]|eukprot:ORY42385.1 hypothetical protein BCR33DRAFT_767228 [Rhizoclosmatium globosum]